jgi:hypothetical protein
MPGAHERTGFPMRAFGKRMDTFLPMLSSGGDAHDKAFTFS